MEWHGSIQITIVIIVIACAAAYAGWRIYKTLAAKDKTCAGCPLKDTCKKTKKRTMKNEGMDNHRQFII